jgi:hypothetical protein
MTPQEIPCCGNCPLATFTRGDNWLNGGVLCGTEELLPDFVATVKRKGCLKHPNARAYLMKDVVGDYTITESELQVYEECIKFIISFGEYRGCNILTLDVATRSIKDIRSRAITLIKEGVKKE